VTLLAARDRQGAVRCYVGLYSEADDTDAPPAAA
jgi:hypothetical protein